MSLEKDLIRETDKRCVGYLKKHRYRFFNEFINTSDDDELDMICMLYAYEEMINKAKDRLNEEQKKAYSSLKKIYSI